MANFSVKRGWVLIVLLLLVLSSCSSYQKLLKSDDVMLKKEKAFEYYESGDYDKTIALLNDIIHAFRGTAEAEKINYYYAMAHYKQKDYIMAAHYFKTFTQGFPRSEHVEEFLFMSAYCKYLLSPRPSLDQTETQQAINELQAFINRFPQSTRVEESNNLIDELRFKLEQKAFNSAVLYFNIRDYMAAVTSFNNVIRQFPDTDFREEALFYIIRSHFLFAENSIQVRQLERYQNVVTAHARLLNRFPESKFLPEANRLLAVSQQQIRQLDNSSSAQSVNQ
jgi:outer membrane protein assembly factor BamD